MVYLWMRFANPSGTKLLTKFMESNALPGHNIFYVNDDVRAEVPEADAALQGFLAANVVCESAVQGAYQITPFGAGAVQYSRHCTDFNRFFCASGCGRAEGLDAVGVARFVARNGVVFEAHRAGAAGGAAEVGLRCPQPRA